MENGHNYLDIIEHYTVEEIHIFHRACAKRGQEAMKMSALAARVGGATDKGFKKFMKDLDASSEKIDRAVPKGKKPKRTDDDAFKSFFGQIAQLPTAAQAQKAVDSATRSGRSAEEVSSSDLDGTITVPIKYHKGPPPR